MLSFLQQSALELLVGADMIELGFYFVCNVELQLLLLFELLD
jgi:hypothetical protein